MHLMAGDGRSSVRDEGRVRARYHACTHQDHMRTLCGLVPRASRALWSIAAHADTLAHPSHVRHETQENKQEADRQWQKMHIGILIEKMELRLRRKRLLYISHIRVLGREQVNPTYSSGSSRYDARAAAVRCRTLTPRATALRVSLCAERRRHVSMPLVHIHAHASSLSVTHCPPPAPAHLRAACIDFVMISAVETPPVTAGRVHPSLHPWPIPLLPSAACISGCPRTITHQKPHELRQ